MKKDHALLDYMSAFLQVPNDAQLAKRLKVLPSAICKIRMGKVPVSAALLISMHEESGIGVTVLRFLAGDFREDTRPSTQPMTARACAALVDSPEVAKLIRGMESGTGVSSFRRQYVAVNLAHTD